MLRHMQYREEMREQKSKRHRQRLSIREKKTKKEREER